MKLALVTGSILLALAGRAVAQPSMTPPVPVSAPAPAPVGEAASEDLALTLSLGGTIASWAALIGSAYLEDRSSSGEGALGLVGGLGILFAPSFGHWYAGDIFTRGLGLRLGGGGLFVAGAVAAVGDAFADESSGSQSSGMGPLLLVVGAGLFVAGTIDDIVTAPGKARRRNVERGFALAPIAAPHTSGLALAGRF